MGSVAFLQYIGSRETDKRADEALQLGIFDLWTPENHYRWKKSRYGGHVSGTVESVEHSRLLLCSISLALCFYVLMPRPKTFWFSPSIFFRCGCGGS